MTIPSFAEVCEIPVEVTPRVVPVDFIDENGHMNIRHYYDLGALAIATVFERMGITDDYRASRGSGFFTAEHHIRYYAEMVEGEEVAVHFRGIERTDKIFHGMSFLTNVTREQLAATLEFTAVHVDLEVRRAQPFEDDIAEAIDAILARTASVEWPSPVCGVMGTSRSGQGSPSSTASPK